MRLRLGLIIAVFGHVVLLPVTCGTQAPLLPLHHQESEFYEFQWPIRRVAIIGAGPGGLINYREFIQAGYDVHLFERDDVPGGNWHYTDETPVDAPIPNADIAVADYVPSLPPKGSKLPYEDNGAESDEALRAHRGPKPIWETLHSNAPAPIQQITEFPWPKGTPWACRMPRSEELVEKRFDDHGRHSGWTLTLKKHVRIGPHSSKATWTIEDFDAVVVATGRYNAPSIPGIPGLKEWGDQFPGRISHSRQYRRPQPHTNQTVLVVGAATSGGEIARDLNPYVKKIYQSIRPENSTKPHFLLELFLRRLPSNVTIIPEIKRFLPPTSRIDTSRVELANGTILSGIDSIIFATGFRYTFPFLPQYHDSSITRDDDEGIPHPRPIVTDGTHLRSLYLDIFYIEEPTIAFVDMNIGMQSFTYAEYIGVALTKVWANKARIPATPELWRRQRAHVKELGGYGRHFQFLGSERTDRNIRYFLGWLNEAAAKYGGRQIDGINPGNAEIAALWNKARFGSDILLGTPVNLTFAVAGDVRINEAVMENLGISTAELIDVYNDNW
ncbi:putative pyridine nucleotide-disulphide oxidoreductase [Lyophyllum shimeji]|uniref:Pyridine nucleotide-disulphide oxidoreductase n=1 Tax=Lyophyllum shimeji TaxID=47721 RepID=A0A9P3UTJ6_LYOSH|nr:putative pyridine nucleotide-disulphide oxidoreductase [Lyophyllum shimeji]